MKLRKKVLSLVLALTMVASVFAIPATASAATLTWTIPTKPMTVDESIVKVAGHAANTTTVHYLGGNLVTARSTGATSTEYPQSVKYVAAEYGIYGSNLTDSPDPYIWNHLYNLKADDEDKVTDTIKPVSGNPMGADLTPQSGYEDLTISGTDQVPHSIGMKADVLLGTNGSGGKTYDDYIQLMKDDYNPIQVAYKASNLGDFIDDMYNLSDAIVKSGKSGRYGDTAKIANNYEAYIKGLQLYVMSQIDSGKVAKKTIAIINSTPNSDGTYTAYTSSVTAGTAASCRAAEYIEATTNNLIEVLGVENTGTEDNKQYLLTADQLLKADAIYTTVQNNSTTGETFREQLKSATGVSDDKIPAIYSQDPDGVFGIQMNSVENIAGIGIYQGFLYPEILNPVYAYTYIVENFYHVTEAKDYKAVTETLLADCSLPEGCEADASGYTTDYITSRINTGLNYYYNNQSKFKGLKVEPTERLEFTVTPEKPEVTTVSLSKAKVASIANKVYTGKSLTPTVKVTVDGKTLTKGTDYTVTYKNNKNPGKATITIKGKGNYTGTKIVTFKIVPKKATVSSVTSTKKATLTVKVKKYSTATGYQIMIAKNSKFTSGKKSYVSSQNTTVTKTFTKLTKGKKYYVKVRAYKTIDGKRVYGTWSAVKTKTVKK